MNPMGSFQMDVYGLVFLPNLGDPLLFIPEASLPHSLSESDSADIR